jgi:NADP-dependent 3-hydroxy acid dehydrogenase YdfG
MTDVDTMVRVNIKSVLYGMQAILPHFKDRNAGHIINISSMLGRMPHATFRSAYTGSKHFVNAITAMIRTEIQQTHPEIQVSLVSPGVVRTDLERMPCTAVPTRTPSLLAKRGGSGGGDIRSDRVASPGRVYA